MFLGAIFAALQIDTWRPDIQFHQIKKAFTPRAVAQIYEAVVDLWLDISDYEDCIARDATNVGAFYTGSYEPETVFRAVSRHALYADKIYLTDPFMDPRTVRDEFNPLLHPEQHRTSAIKFSFLWVSLYPWIERGLVGFLRPIDDFVPGLKHEILEIQRRRFESNPALRKALDDETEAIVKQAGPRDRGIGEFCFLSHSDELLWEMFQKAPTGQPYPGSKEEFCRYLQFRRDTHPYYVERLPGLSSEFLQETSGANYELAKRMCILTNSHLITDLSTRWKEVELDRAESKPDDQNWAPFAKAFQNARLNVLNNIELSSVLRLREENRLENMRLFFRKLWKACREPNTYSEENAVNLAAELNEKIAESAAEWKKIDQDLLKWSGASAAALISSGVVGFVPAAATAATTGVAGLIQAAFKRTSFKDRYPAGFFLGLKKDNAGGHN